MRGMLAEKTALITGAASGIGLAIAQAYAREGAKVVLADKAAEAAEKAAAGLREHGLHAVSSACDVTDEQQIEETIQFAVTKYGNLDILVNNAGLQHVSPIEDFPTETFELMTRIMLTAPFIAIKKALPIMKESGYGRIINMASINGLVGFAGKAAYNSAKHGVIGLTKVAALEAAPHGITVNAFCPGYADTPLVRGQLTKLAAVRNVPLEDVLEEVIYPLVPQKRLIELEEISDYCTYIASEKAKGITGQAIVLDGGYTVQ